MLMLRHKKSILHPSFLPFFLSFARVTVRTMNTNKNIKYFIKSFFGGIGDVFSSSVSFFSPFC